jgi:hypothetical protein
MIRGTIRIFNSSFSTVTVKYKLSSHDEITTDDQLYIAMIR